MDKRNNAYLYITCFIVSIGGLLLGISANVSGASMYFGDFFGLTSGSFQEGLAVSITMLATFIGNFFAGNVSERIGRKKSLILAALLFCFCTLGSALSQTYMFFLISRFIGGLGIGISLLVVPMYIAELAPSDERGLTRIAQPTEHRSRLSGGLRFQYVGEWLVRQSGTEMALDARIGYFVPDYLPYRIDIRTGKSGMDRKPEPTER